MNVYLTFLEEEAIVVYRNQKIEVKAREIGFGCWKTWIKDLKTGKERFGPYCPGNPKEYIFDPEDEVWILRRQFISINKYWTL